MRNLIDLLCFRGRALHTDLMHYYISFDLVEYQCSFYMHIQT